MSSEGPPPSELAWIRTMRPFAAHLSGMLDDVCVLNAGVIGFISGQEVVQLVSDLIAYHPDLVITLDGFNDLFIQLGRNRVWPDMGANEFDSLVGRLVKLHQLQSNLWYGLLNAFRGIHAFCHMMYRITKSILRMMCGKHLRAYMKSHIPFLSKEKGKDMSDDATIEKLSEEYATNLAKITQMGIGFGYRHLAVLQPALRSDRDCYTPPGRFHFSKRQIALYETFLKKTMQKLRKLNVAHYSAHLDFKEADTLYLDDIHLTGKGYQELAAATVKVLQEKGLIESKVEIETLGRDRRYCP